MDVRMQASRFNNQSSVEPMKFIKLMPFEAELDGDKLPCGLWQNDNPNTCEFFTDPPSEAGACYNTGFFYGTDNELEPKFCARHFYQIVVSGDSKGNYQLTAG